MTVTHLVKSPSSSIKQANNINLKSLNTMALSCIADTLITVENEAQLEQVLSDWQQQHPNYSDTDSSEPSLFILSGGSNVLLPPQLHTCVLRPMLTGIDIIKEDANSITIDVSAGESWHNLVVKTVNNGWYGLENLALIPGLTGAAPIQNIGAYGVQLADFVTHVRALHIPTLTWHNLDKQACQFGYRDSVFKQETGQWLITKVGLALHKDASQMQVKYADIKEQASILAMVDGRETYAPMDVMNAIIAMRKKKLPDPAILPNCGSFFKNPVVSVAQFTQLKLIYPSIVGYVVDNAHIKVAAGWLIDDAGLKGDGIAPILTHKQQALVLTNHGEDNSCATTQSDVATTQAYIQKIIFAKYGITLEREPMWIDATGKVNLQNTVML